jgi:hypothetical protein
MEYDLHTSVKAAVAMDQQTINSATTTDGNAIDMKDSVDPGNVFRSIEYVIFTGTVTAAGTSVTPLLEESDTGAFSGEETAVPATEILGSVTIDDDADDDKVFRIGSIGKKRYQRLALVSVGATNMVVGAIAILGNPTTKPVAEQAT